jgi:serine/threonine protein kinase
VVSFRLTGKNAFIEGTEGDWQSKLRNRVLDWDGLYEIGVSEQCMCRCIRVYPIKLICCRIALAKDWLHKMIEPNPERRMSMQEALQHPWLAEEEEVTTPLMIETFSVKNNVMRGNGNPTFGDSSFEQSIENSTPVTPASISAPRGLEDQCSQDLEALRIDTNVGQFEDVAEQPTRNGLSATDSANIGSIVGAFPSVPSDIGIPYPEKSAWVSEGQQSAIFVGELGSAWSPTAITNGRPKISPQDTVLPPGNKRKTVPPSVPDVPDTSRPTSPASSSSLSSLSDDEQHAMAVDTTPTKSASRGPTKRRAPAPVRRAATGIAANLRSSRALDNSKPAKRRKLAANSVLSDPSTPTMTKRTSSRQAPRSLFPDEDEQPPVEDQPLQNRRTTRAKGARR